MAKPSREKSTPRTGSGALDNPGRDQDVQGMHQDKSFYVTSGQVMTPVALHAQGTIKPAPLHDRGYNKEPGQDTMPSNGVSVAKGGLASLSAFGLKNGGK